VKISCKDKRRPSSEGLLLYLLEGRNLWKAGMLEGILLIQHVATFQLGGYEKLAIEKGREV